MIAMESLANRGRRWLVEHWTRLAGPTLEALLEGAHRATRDLESLWSRHAFRLSLSRRGVCLSRLPGVGIPPVQPGSAPTQALYEASGRWGKPRMNDRSDAWTRPPERQGRWTLPPFETAFSQAGQVAGAALNSVNAAPGELDRFVERVRQGRRAGYYPAEVFEQARALLRRTAPLTRPAR
ncbi:MAG: hypothetical protein HQM02_07690 [Magnetococcales bacterium]|nr:hypothetical protein [Magnetococcales bacterium]